MHNRLEDRIRSFLAKDLGLLEAGLELVSEEYPLPNSLGAGGKVDILAKDPFGYWVIIEIKRSDQAARQALHEISKYTALFRTIHGFDETRIRVIVVSTDWHELLVPFSEYSKAARYSLKGVLIKSMEDGTVTHFEEVSLAPSGDRLEFSRMQAIYFYASAQARDEALRMIAQAVEHNVITDYVLFSCDHAGRKAHPGFCHAIYLAFVSPIFSSKQNEILEIRSRIDWDEDVDLPEENLLVAVNEMFTCHDSFEIGYPEKLVTMCIDWNVEVSGRAGRFKRESSLLDDNQIMLMAKSVEGGSPYYLEKASSPRFAAGWRELRANIELVVDGNDLWSKSLPLFFSEIEERDPHASVYITLYSSFNFPMTLLNLMGDRPSTCPHLEIVVDYSKKDTHILLSRLAWNGQIILDSPTQVMQRIYGGIEEWTWLTALHLTHEKEDLAMAEHGFSTPIVEFVFHREVAPELFEMTLVQGDLVRAPLDPNRHKDISEFIGTHVSYLTNLCAKLREYANGI